MLFYVKSVLFFLLRITFFTVLACFPVSRLWCFEDVVIRQSYSLHRVKSSVSRRRSLSDGSYIALLVSVPF